MMEEIMELLTVAVMCHCHCCSNQFDDFTTFVVLSQCILKLLRDQGATSSNVMVSLPPSVKCRCHIDNG